MLTPTFTITKGTDVEFGKRLTKMGYEHKRTSKGSSFKVKEICPDIAKQLVLPCKRCLIML
jgi:hypothetical protein